MVFYCKKNCRLLPVVLIYDNIKVVSINPTEVKVTFKKNTDSTESTENNSTKPSDNSNNNNNTSNGSNNENSNNKQ